MQHDDQRRRCRGHSGDVDTTYDTMLRGARNDDAAARIGSRLERRKGAAHGDERVNQDSKYHENNSEQTKLPPALHAAFKTYPSAWSTCWAEASATNSPSSRFRAARTVVACRVWATTTASMASG